VFSAIGAVRYDRGNCLWQMTEMRNAGVTVGNDNKKAQLSLRKTRYSLHSFCCSTDLQGHPRSKIFLCNL